MRTPGSLSSKFARSARIAWVLVVCSLGFPALGFCADSNEPPDQSTSQPVSTISVKVNVVNVLATVRDKHGQLAPELTRDDFKLLEDGRPQTIRYFTRETDLPLTLGLLVDTSLSQRRVLDAERTASRSFVSRVVREDRDKAFVIHFDREVELLQDLTSSHDKLGAALEELDTPQFERPSGTNGPGSGRGRRGSGGGWSGPGTLLYDSVFLASDEMLKKQQGRKALIVLSDGVDTGSKESLDYAIETAQRSDAVVYAILFKDDEGYAGGGFGGSLGIPGTGGPGRRGRMGRPSYPTRERVDGKKVLERIARETGGRMFEVSKKQSVEQIYTQIEEELRHQYSLGYTPDRGPESAAAFHKIQLSTKNKDLVVQARDGYYGEQ